jgi:DNA-binding NarL/FixJ family response regulator
MKMPASKAKVMLVDDHPILRHGMAMLINLDPDMMFLPRLATAARHWPYLKPDIIPISF